MDHGVEYFVTMKSCLAHGCLQIAHFASQFNMHILLPGAKSLKTRSGCRVELELFADGCAMTRFVKWKGDAVEEKEEKRGSYERG